MIPQQAHLIAVSLTWVALCQPIASELINLKWRNRLGPRGTAKANENIIFIQLKPEEVTANAAKHKVHTHYFTGTTKNKWDNVVNLDPGVEHDIQTVKGQSVEWRFSPDAIWSTHIEDAGEMLCDWQQPPKPHFPHCSFLKTANG